MHCAVARAFGDTTKREEIARYEKTIHVRATRPVGCGQHALSHERLLRA
jgi:hypothetical protein